MKMLQYFPARGLLSDLEGRRRKTGGANLTEGLNPPSITTNSPMAVRVTRCFGGCHSVGTQRLLHMIP